MVEAKGQVDRNVPAKARAAVEWCKAASTKPGKWEYVYVPEGVFQRFQGTTFAELTRVCSPALHEVTTAPALLETLPLFAEAGGTVAEAEVAVASGLVEDLELRSLPERLRKAIEEAISLYMFFERKPDSNYAPAFAALLGVLDETAKGLVIQRLMRVMPAGTPDQRTWFEPYLGKADPKTHRHYQELARNLQKTLVFKSGVSPLGLLRNCFDYALNDKAALTGVFEAIRSEFRYPGAREQFSAVQAINEFRNTRVAHQEKPLNDEKEARKALKEWIDGLILLWTERADLVFSDDCRVELIQLRPKEATDERPLFSVKVVLPKLIMPVLNDTMRQAIKIAVERQLQPQVDYRFGAGNVRLECQRVERGSLELLVAGIVLIWAFLKDYEKVKSGAVSFTADVKQNCGKLKRVIERAVKKVGGGDDPPPPRIEPRL